MKKRDFPCVSERNLKETQCFLFLFFCRIHEGMAYFVTFQIENKETCRALVYLMNFLVKFPSGDISYFYSVTSDMHNN